MPLWLVTRKGVLQADKQSSFVSQEGHTKFITAPITHIRGMQGIKDCKYTYWIPVNIRSKSYRSRPSAVHLAV
jgi:hypothetical protein